MNPETKIIQYGMGRSGTTLVYNILSEVFNRKIIVKSHTYLQIKDSKNRLVLACYRDFRDTMASHWRVVQSQESKNYKKDFVNDNATRQMNVEEVEYWCNRKLEEYGRNLLNFKKHWRNNIIYLKYEDYVIDYNIVYDGIEKLTGKSIPREKRNEISEKWSIENSRKIADKYNNFNQYDVVTHMHGHHIHKGLHGSWKSFVPSDLHGYVNKKFEKILIEWGYKI